MKKEQQNIDHYIRADSDNKFILYLKQPIISIKNCSVGHFINKVTGEDIGQYKEIYKYYYDKDFNLLKNPVEEEDCYEYTVY